MEETQITLRDSIANAIEEHAPEEIVQETQVDRPRDESGRFAKQAQETEQKPIEVQQEPQEAQAESQQVKPRPSSWKKDYEDQWTKLDPTLQDYIAQRESEFAKGVSTYKQNWDSVEPIYEAMQPFMPLLQQHNIQPQQWISNLGNAHKALALGSPEEKLQMFARLANDYGVNLGALTGQQQYDPQFSMITQELGQVKNQLAEFQQQREAQEMASLQNDIEAFKQNAPHFEDVRETMAQLLQSGVASDLKTAYDKAIRLHDDIWQQQQQEAQQAQAKANAEQNQQKVAQAKAKAVSPRSSSPTGMTNSGNGKKDLRSTLEEQFNAMEGRV